MRTDDLASAIDAVADTMIPPSGDWPAPSALQLGADLLPRLREDEREKVAGTIARLDAADGFAQASPAERISALTELSEADPVAFELLRRCVYYAYYAQPPVIRVMRAKGYDINEAPQPGGYRMDPITSEDLSRIDRSRIVWIPADKVGMPLRTAS
ncbi:hypothetical protein WDU99_14470 [Microbacterium sp. Mu-80]|uniref:Gluconate 2-dehydrogenase subunit 3 family protein n=1 Tax=Microbacterium bandirmense TaxID=3122050 RepID=A0ABU8LDW0_9MICO